MPMFDDAERGRESQGSKRNDFDNAVQAWENAPENEKAAKATLILSHARGIGVKLAGLIDNEKKVAAILRDAGV